MKKIYYINKICIIKEEFTKYRANNLMKSIELSYIDKYKKYYFNFINIFQELDNKIGNEINDSNDYILNRIHEDHFGLGMYIRNNFIYKKMNSDVETIFGRTNEDNISTEILNGYRFYKLRLFDIFK